MSRLLSDGEKPMVEGSLSEDFVYSGFVGSIKSALRMCSKEQFKIEGLGLALRKELAEIDRQMDNAHTEIHGLNLSVFNRYKRSEAFKKLLKGQPYLNVLALNEKNTEALLSFLNSKKESGNFAAYYNARNEGNKRWEERHKDKSTRSYAFAALNAYFLLPRLDENGMPETYPRSGMSKFYAHAAAESCGENIDFVVQHERFKMLMAQKRYRSALDHFLGTIFPVYINPSGSEMQVNLSYGVCSNLFPKKFWTKEKVAIFSKLCDDVNHEALPWLDDPTMMPWSNSNEPKTNSIDLQIHERLNVSMAMDCMDQLKEILEGVAKEKEDHKAEINHLKSKIKTLKRNTAGRLRRRVHHSLSEHGSSRKEHTQNAFDVNDEEEVIWT